MSPKWPLFREKTQVPSPLISSSGIGLAPKWAAASLGTLCELNPFPGSVLAQSGSGSQNRLFQPLKFDFFFLLPKAADVSDSLRHFMEGACESLRVMPGRS